MKFKYPKEIIIGETKFEVKYSKKVSGGEFQYPWKGKRGYIKFGIADIQVNPIRHLAVIIHELKEIVQIEQSTRYTRRDEHSDNSYEFHYTHKEHTDLCARLAGLLTHFIG